MSKERRLEGLELFLYFITRFKMSPTEAIDSMTKHNQDMSFLDIPIKELLEERN